jgi:hypothetical protein
MANHAYVIPPEMPTFDQVDKIVRRVVAEKFPMLVVEAYPDKAYFERIRPELKGYWFVYHPENRDYFALEFWFGSNLLELDCSDIPHVSLGQERIGAAVDMERAFAVEFRHGHSYDILWWIEYEIREEVGCALNARMFDDGVGDCGKPRTDRYDTLAEYRKQQNGKIVRRLTSAVANWLRAEKKTAPKSIRRLYGT